MNVAVFFSEAESRISNRIARNVPAISSPPGLRFMEFRAYSLNVSLHFALQYTSPDILHNSLEAGLAGSQDQYACNI